ncbi:MAG: PDZ domain-containing protein [Nocardioidaceae bacterium]
MKGRRAALSSAVVVLVLLLAVAVFVPVPYVVMAPGLTENTIGDYDGKPVIEISGAETYPTSGHLDLTTVSVTSPDSDVRLPDVLEAWWSSDEILLPRDVVYPPEQSASEVQRQNATEMLDSQESAIAVGLAQAGVDAVRVAVADVTAGAPADGMLRKGDELVSVDGQKLASTQATVEAISALPPGSRVELAIVRDGTGRTVQLTTAPSPDDESRSRIGVSLHDIFDPPFKVTIELGREIGGPSAGLMFSLGIYDKLTPGELTGGAHVAGTGTIDVAGNVGEIGGIQQKMAGAHGDGASIFLVPAGDCADALQSAAADDLVLVKVATIDDAVSALEALQDDDVAAVQRCDDVA